MIFSANDLLGHDRRRRTVRYGLGAAHGVLLAALILIGLGPILLLAKAAITPTQDTLRQPMAFWPHGMDWANLSTAWTTMQLGHYRRLRPVGAVPEVRADLNGLVLGTFARTYSRAARPAVPDDPAPAGWNHSLLNSFWAVWLPAGAKG